MLRATESWTEVHLTWGCRRWGTPPGRAAGSSTRLALRPEVSRPPNTAAVWALRPKRKCSASPLSHMENQRHCNKAKVKTQGSSISPFSHSRKAGEERTGFYIWSVKLNSMCKEDIFGHTTTHLKINKNNVSQQRKIFLKHCFKTKTAVSLPLSMPASQPGLSGWRPSCCTSNNTSC